MGRGLKYAAAILPLASIVFDFQDVTAVGSQPAALQTLESPLSLRFGDRFLGRRWCGGLRPGVLAVGDKKGHGGKDANGQEDKDDHVDIHPSSGCLAQTFAVRALSCGRFSS